MSKYIGDVHILDYDDYLDREDNPEISFTAHRSGTGGQTYRMTWHEDKAVWTIRNVVSRHSIRPGGRIGKALIEEVLLYSFENEAGLTRDL